MDRLLTPTKIYRLAIDLGIKVDFRSKREIDKVLKRRKEQHEKLSDDEKRLFDQDRLWNPYSDTRILHLAEENRPVKKIMVGIDVEGEELLLAKQLGDIDLVIAHHPEGNALAGLDDVMHLQADVLAQYGVPINIAESLLKPRISEITRSLSGANHERAVDMARVLGINFMCVHTPSDNLAASFLKHEITRAKPEFVGDLMKLLRKIPEYQEAIRRGAGPMLFAGAEDRHCGKIALTEITGGTEGTPDIYERLAQAGIGTVVAMHQSEKHKEAAEKAHINAVIAGHMSSDSIGMNHFVDELQRRGVKGVLAVGGFIRVVRVKHK